MKLQFSRKDAAAALRELKRSGARKVLLSAASSLLAGPEGLAVLREAADFCIERGSALSIAGLAPCFLPGYARYLLAAGAGALPCAHSARCFLAGACTGIPRRHAAVAGLFKPPPRGFTDLEQCMLAILARKSGISTAQVLKAAKGIKICASCSNEGEVFRAAERLIKFGLVSKEYKGGVYLWSKKRD
ncbi:MAG: hypothetical protein A2234_04210 [Elusimicrobia bacterium RIFOXYA2_FULL_58_8]|nr:MAG: hypothetical protein A2285_06025 [Elusimicrobia bacterium RIFOXYA12_FULL_57_11]OGS16996.1 MAG: hypothetical protein A2234_04210 [Elusimicrobia bacterium RIFOXYA2_FULL_58_8]